VKQVPGDYELVERLHEGDVEAFDLLFERYSGKLYAFGLKYLRSSVEAEEMVQSIFLKIWESQKNLRKESTFKSFLFTIAYNDICKIFRKRYYKQRFIDNIQYDNSQASYETEERIDFSSDLARVYQIIEKLPERQRIIFIKSRQEGKTTKVIAKEVGLSPGTVDNYISESLKFIRTQFIKESLPVLLFFSLYFL
jgi:RNA polymerase sigma-70 factor (ECF subfamily)